MQESPLFAKSYDFLAWLIPVTIKFPRQQRFVLAARLQSNAFDFIERLYDAIHSENCLISLRKADAALQKIRFYLRLCHDSQIVSTRQYHHAGKRIEEIGRLLGAWIKKQKGA